MMLEYPENFEERVAGRWHAVPPEQRVFFMHVPKTAGTAVKWYLEQRGLETYHEIDPHPFSFLTIEKITSPIGARIDGMNVNLQVAQSYPLRPNTFDNMLKFSLTRNPFSWLVSWYFHGGPHDGEDGWGHVNYIYGIRSFDEFVEKFCSPRVQWNHGLNSAYWNRMMYCQWFGQDGLPIVNFAIRSENLFTGMERLLRASGLCDPASEVDHPPRKKSNFSKRQDRDYREYYTSESREIVERYFSRELQVFGYDFDGPTDERIIYDVERMQMSYTLANDLFMHKGVTLTRGK